MQLSTKCSLGEIRNFLALVQQQQQQQQRRRKKAPTFCYELCVCGRRMNGWKDGRTDERIFFFVLHPQARGKENSQRKGRICEIKNFGMILF